MDLTADALETERRRGDALKDQVDKVREAQALLQQKHDGLAQEKGSLQAQLLGLKHDRDELNAKMEAANRELGSVGAANRELQQQLETARHQAQADGEEDKDVGRRAMIALPHACQCIHRALEHLSEKEGSTSILASLSLALLALQDTADPARRLLQIDTKRSMMLLAREVTWPVQGDLAQPCREALYAVALASTFSAGRKQIAEVPDASHTLALICEYCSQDEIKKWAGLALGCTLMVQTVRQQALEKDAAAGLVQALAPLLDGADANAQSFACLALGNLAVEQAARSRCDVTHDAPWIRTALDEVVLPCSIITHGVAARGLCRCLSVPNLLTQRYAVGAIRNIAVSKRCVVTSLLFAMQS